ncbi:MAG: hypothetical protein EBR02_00435 [Alphaproteobacteria bacterium]|nr:hypothetical protein [Alphaproteobacteria bacterium]
MIPVFLATLLQPLRRRLVMMGRRIRIIVLSRASVLEVNVGNAATLIAVFMAVNPIIAVAEHVRVQILITVIMRHQRLRRLYAIEALARFLAIVLQASAIHV